ncbi:MAG: extracellular solute-binding protein family 5 [Akkermansiaceae bacterium]|nr:extracellular solute-binding protein family 5 [Akkermansiaceae bacterium]
MKLPNLLVAAATAVLALASCHKNSKSQAAYDNTAERTKFYADYNKKVARGLADKKTELDKALAGDLPEGDRKLKQTELDDLTRRLQRPDYFETKTEADLPKDLVWDRGLDEPEIGSPDAKKGGTFHTFIQGNAFPPNIRCCGRDANNSFRSNHWDDIEIPLTNVHPNTGKIIPGIADRWSVAPDGQSVYYHIDPAARWSDGRKVTSGDFTMTLYVYLSPYLSESFYRIYYSDQYWGIATYGPDYVCVRLAYPKPMAAASAALVPFQEDFYKEFGSDFETRYNWRPRPTTCAYVIDEKDILKGRSISLTRVKDWWAKDRKYYRNRFNADRIEYALVRDEETIFQLFLRGDIDTYLLGDATKWYEKTEVPAVFNGYIEKATFYNDFPAISRGLYLNMANPLLANQDIRIGLQHATNWDAVIKLELRGDAERMDLIAQGFGEYSNPNVHTRPFSVDLARESFAKAGFTTVGPDGILMDSQGRRLSFTINFTRNPVIDPMMLRLKEEAKRSGLEYKLEAQDSTASFQKVMRKEHEIAFSGWQPQPPFPDYFQQFHSSEAYEPGSTKPKPMSNNICSFADTSVDPILEANRNARSEQDVKDTSYKLEEILNERAVWVPAYYRPFYRTGYWRWIRWPSDFNVRLVNEPEMSYVYWIDEDVKKETLDARRDHKTFPEVNRIYDQYRKQSAAK